MARYREELHDHPSKWAAMRIAWRAAVEPIGASAATVILGLLCLMLSQLGNTRGLGPVGAIGIAGAVVSALTFLPAVLLLFGRRIFWPVVPRVDHVHAEDAVGTRGVWGRVAALVGRHPRRTWVVTLLALLVLGGFVPTFRAEGVTQSQLFLNKVESVTGQEVLARHFPAGSGSPVEVVVAQDRADQVVATLTKDEDVSSAAVTSSPPGRARRARQGRRRKGPGPGHPAPGRRQPGRRGHGHATAHRAGHRRHGRAGRRQLGLQPGRQAGERARPAGDHPRHPAGDPGRADAAPAFDRGAPVLLVLANVVSFAATLGVAALVFNHVFDYPGSDPSTPLYAFVFLVALGIDYSIFLMTRVREESVARSTRPGILVALAVTGGVITSAGVVLAATFSALSIIPILFLAQIAFLVAFGVLLDTLVVRSLLVPALSYDIGARIWWPSLLAGKPGRHERTSRTH